MQALLGDELQRANGTIISTSDALAKKKIIGLYFSAHWCPPCNEFTPLLVQAYEDIREHNDHDLEVIYISYDASPEEFAGYFSEMPWLALPYEKRELQKAIHNKLGVIGVPMLYFFNSDGMLLESDGRELVEDNITNVDNIVGMLLN